MRYARSNRQPSTSPPNQPDNCTRARRSSSASSSAGTPTTDTATSARPAGAYAGEAFDVTTTWFTGPCPSPSSMTTASDTGGRSAA